MVLTIGCKGSVISDILQQIARKYEQFVLKLGFLLEFLKLPQQHEEGNQAGQ